MSNPRNLRLIATLPGTSGRVPTCAFSPDNQVFVTGSHAGNLRLWSRVDGHPRGTLGPVSADVIVITFATDSTWLAAIGADKITSVWHLPTEATTRVKSKSQAWHAEFLPRSNQLALTVGKRLQVVDGATGLVTFDALAHSSAAELLAVSPDGSRVVTCGGKNLSLWDLDGGTCLCTAEAPGAVNELCFSHGGDAILSTGWPGSTVVWNGADLSPLQTLAHPDIAWTAAFLDADSSVVTGCNDGGVRLWDRQSAAVRLTLRPPAAPYVGRVAAAQIRSLVAATAGPNVYVWDGESIGDLAVATHSSDVHYVVFAPDGSRLVTVASDFVGLWST